MIAFLGAIVTIAFIVYLVLAIRLRKKGLPQAKKQFKIMWILLAAIVVLVIIDPNKGKTTQTEQAASATTKEIAQAEHTQAETKATNVENKTDTEPARAEYTKVPEYTIVEDKLGQKDGIWYLTLSSVSTNEKELKALVDHTRAMAADKSTQVNAIHVGILQSSFGSKMYTARGKLALTQRGLAQTGLTNIDDSEFSYQYEAPDTTVKQPTDAEWQESYKDILLGEAMTYIELSVKGTLSKERFDSAVGVLNKYVDRVEPEKQKEFQKLADLVSANDLNGAKKKYKELGGENFEELNKKAVAVNFK